MIIFQITLGQTTATDAQNWFESQGVQLKTEPDGRMFPITDNSQTIMDAIQSAANTAGVCISTQCQVISVRKKKQSPSEKEEQGKEYKDNNDTDGFIISYRTSNGGNHHDHGIKEMECDGVILATGSSKWGYELAESLGHKIVQPVPSLFTLSSKEQVRSETGIFHGLSGVSIPLARITLNVKGEFLYMYVYILRLFPNFAWNTYYGLDRLYYSTFHYIPFQYLNFRLFLLSF